MIYGPIEFLTERGSVSITRKQRVILRHYLDTDRSDQEHLGRESTVITATILTTTLDELRAVEQLLHGTQELDLEYRDQLYKRVKPDAEFVTEAVDNQSGWRTIARFIALDPVPYSVATGDALY